MDVSTMSPKKIGALGESIVCEYLKRKGFRIIDRNVAKKTGEIDIIAQKGSTLHFVEVKTILCYTFPGEGGYQDGYDPSANLHAEKIRKVARTGEWYMTQKRWEGAASVDAALVWLRKRDGRAQVSYLPQIL